MSINNEQELEARIHSFLERKMRRFPELAKLEKSQERSGLTVKIQANMAEWFHPVPRRAH